MKRFLVFAGLTIFATLFAGCKPSGTAKAVGGPASEPTHAQSKLPTVKLWLGAKELTAEVATTPQQEQAGLMFRTNLAENEAMLFVFPQPAKASFWMKNTSLPLSTAFIAGNGAILELHDLQPQDTNTVMSASANIIYVLETRQGWFQTNHIGVNTVVATDRGPLHRIFFGR